MIKSKVLAKHCYQITPPSETRKRWQTYVPIKEGTRKKITAATEKRLIEKLEDFYVEASLTTLEKLYPIWEARRRNSNVSDRSVRRNYNHWVKYYADEAIVSVQLEKLTFLDIEDFFHRCINEYYMTLKELNNMKFILKDLLKLAHRMRIIDHNPWNDVEINTGGCKPQNRRSAAERTFSDKETVRLFEIVNEEALKKPNVTDYHAIQLLFLLGLRIGEVVALKFSDINLKTSEIHIHRTETMSVDLDGTHHVIVVDHTKKKSISGNRFLPLGERELELFKTVREINEANGFYQDDFIFCDQNDRMTIRQLASRVERLCKKAGIENRTCHDIRRTVASQLHLNNVPIKIIKNFLGHASEVQTWQYIYDKNEKEDTAKMINNSLEIFWGLMGTQEIEK